MYSIFIYIIRVYILVGLIDIIILKLLSNKVTLRMSIVALLAWPIVAYYLILDKDVKSTK